MFKDVNSKHLVFLGDSYYLIVLVLVGANFEHQWFWVTHKNSTKRLKSTNKTVTKRFILDVLGLHFFKKILVKR